MYKCINCNKEFKFESEFTRHKNRKTDCNKNNNFNCSICKSNFNYKSDYLRHEKTKKHITNYNIHINGNNNINVNGNVENSFNHIINLTLNTNSFINTDISYISRSLINDIGNYVYLETINNDDLSLHNKIIILFDEVINILEKLHFNIGVEENHNLKILLVFPGLKHSVYEYLILEIDQNTKKISWKSVSYETILNNILDHLLRLNNKCKNENYIHFINFLKKNLIDNQDNINDLQSIINKKLSQMYIDFNNKQNKPERDIKFLFTEKLQEYMNYRTNECTLVNGFTPDILDSSIN
jgi:hypothetical protein